MSDQERTAANVDECAEVFVAVRDKLKAMDEAHELARKPWLEKKEKLSGWLLNFLETNGLDNAKTRHGTVHTTTRSSASLADAEAFMQYVIAHNEFDLLDRRANATAVKQFVKEHDGNLPPGVNLTSMVTVGVRRA
jgi:hypothetical protein